VPAIAAGDFADVMTGRVDGGEIGELFGRGPVTSVAIVEQVDLVREGMIDLIGESGGQFAAIDTQSGSLRFIFFERHLVGLMSMGLLYWILMLFGLAFGLWANWPKEAVTGAAVKPLGGTVILFLLLLVLGWKVFGPPVQ
jgi:hypothetical protein